MGAWKSQNTSGVRNKFFIFAASRWRCSMSFPFTKGVTIIAIHSISWKMLLLTKTQVIQMLWQIPVMPALRRRQGNLWSSWSAWNPNRVPGQSGKHSKMLSEEKGKEVQSSHRNKDAREAVALPRSISSGSKEISSTVKDIHVSLYSKKATKGYDSACSVRTLF